MKTLLLLTITACAAFAQEDFDFKSLDQFGVKATETSNVTLDADALKAAGSLLGNDVDLSSKLKNVKAVYVRSYKFARAGQYDPKLLAPLMAYLNRPEWKKVVDVKEKEESSMVCLKTASGGGTGGFAVLSMNPTAVDIVFISGSLSLNDIGKLNAVLSIGDGKKKQATDVR